VSGPLGASIKGHHLTFEPRIEQGMFLAHVREVTSCMDLTDGLAKDAPSLAGDDFAAVLDTNEIPPSMEALEFYEGKPDELRRHLLCDGEDYELIFTLKPAAAEAFEADWQRRFGGPVFRIGSLRRRTADGPRLIDAATGEPLSDYHGYEHLG
jgi:thiamine-monophosphate kinase